MIIPKGWKLVPKVATDAMLERARRDWLGDPMRRSSTLWAAMLAAAPTAPAGEPKKPRINVGSVGHVEQPVSDPDGLRSAAAALLEKLPTDEVGLATYFAADEVRALKDALSATAPDERDIAATSITALQSAFYEGFEAGATEDDGDDAWERSSARLRAGKEGEPS